LSLAIELTKNVIKTEAVDEARIYISGLSMGGMGSFEAVYRFPKMFAAAAVICGAGDPSAYSINQTKTSFWIFHGDVDKSVDVENSRVMYNRLKELKADVNYSEYPNVAHNSWDNAFAEPDFLKWMFSKKR
jgi:predicted peptidase